MSTVTKENEVMSYFRSTLPQKGSSDRLHKKISVTISCGSFCIWERIDSSMSIMLCHFCVFYLFFDYKKKI